MNFNKKSIIFGWNSNDYGHCIEKPILLSSIANEIQFLNELVHKVNGCFFFQRLGSISSKESNPIDVYEIITYDGKIRDLIFFNVYSKSNLSEVIIPENYEIRKKVKLFPFNKASKILTSFKTDSLFNFSIGVNSRSSNFPFDVINNEINNYDNEWRGKNQKFSIEFLSFLEELKLRRNLIQNILKEIKKNNFTIKDIINAIETHELIPELEREIILFRKFNNSTNYEKLLKNNKLKNNKELFIKITKIEEFDSIQKVFSILNYKCFESKNIKLKTAFEMLIAIQLLLEINKNGVENESLLIYRAYLKLPITFYKTFSNELFETDRIKFPYRLHANKTDLLNYFIENPSLTYEFDYKGRVWFNQRSFLPNLQLQLNFDFDFYFKLLPHDPMSLKYAPDDLKDNSELVTLAVSSHQFLIEKYSHLEFGGEMIITMTPFEFASDRLKNDVNLVLELINFNSYNYNYANEDVKNNINVVLSVIEQPYFNNSILKNTNPNTLRNQLLLDKYKRIFGTLPFLNDNELHEDLPF
jgi:hypothetical protein